MVHVKVTCIRILLSSAAMFSQNSKDSIVMYMAITVLVVSTYLPVYGRLFKTFGWAPLVTYRPIRALFCILHNFRSVGRSCINSTGLGSVFFLPFGTTRKHPL